MVHATSYDNDAHPTSARVSAPLSKIQKKLPLRVLSPQKLLARKADRLPAAPLDDHPDFVALKDATQFARLAHEYRNCLDTHVVRAATGRAAFYIPKLMSGLIVELLRHTYAGKDLWVLKGLHARGNARVGRRDRQDIEALLRLRGITPLDMGHAVGITDKLAAVLSPDVDFHDNY